jgi:phenylalanyl-tRNA synthetase beta chain
MGAVLENIKIQPSPAWMQARLIASGMEPINNIVDITNYVMLETGNPLHAFDADKLAGKAEKKITVRRAGKREKLTLLDGSDLELSEDDLVIADSEKPLALAGIKGGKDSGINSETSSIILEAANFNAYSIRKTRQRHTIQTDSQARFEKSISPFLAGKAMQRAVELLEKYAGADLKKVVEESFFSDEKQTVDFDLEAIEKLLGEKISLDKALKILENLGFEIVLKEKTKGVAKMPRERLDVESGNDLAEEIGRIIGYEKIKPEPLRVEIKEPAYNQEREMEWKMKEILAGLGFDEVINYSFYGKKEAEDGQIKGKHWELENPIASDKNLMRKTLLPAIIENVAFNRKNFDDFSLFELSRVYTTDEKKPEKLKLAGACFDKNTARDAIFYETKGKLEAFIEKIAGVEAEFNFLQESLISFLHPVRTAEIFVEGKKAGFLGEFNPDLSGKYKIKEPFCLFELDFDALFKNAAKEKIFREIQKFPSVERDLAMFVNMETSFKEVKEIIEKAGGKHLQGIELFDIYEDRKQNRKSFAFHFDFYNPKKTLTGEEADLFVEKIIAELEKKGVEVRKN